MRRVLRCAIACASVVAAAIALPAHAVVPITYIFDVAGTGLMSGFNGVSNNTYYETPFSGAQITFVVPDVTSASFFSTSIGTGNAIFTAGTTGVGFTFNSPFLGLNGGGGVCFANPTGLFPTGPVTLTNGIGCGAMSYTNQGSFTKSVFSGVVTKMSVISGDASGQGASAKVTNVGAVPESATWAMMVFGFGGMGYTIRRRRTGAIRIA